MISHTIMPHLNETTAQEIYNYLNTYRKNGNILANDAPRLQQVIHEILCQTEFEITKQDFEKQFESKWKQNQNSSNIQ